MIKSYLKFFVVLLLLLAGNGRAQDMGSCDGFNTSDSNNSSSTADKTINNNQIKKNAKQKSAKSKSNYLGSFKLLVPHSISDH